jgi:hypothetical protein
MNLNLRKIVSTAIIAAMFFWAPSFIPARAQSIIGCGLAHPAMITVDTAFAGLAGVPLPCPPVAMHAPAWLWVAFACPASIILSGLVANFKDHRQLTYWEAWTCGLLYWFGKPPMQPHH